MKTKEIILSVLLLAAGAGSFWAWDKILGKPFLATAILLYAVVFGFFLLLIKTKWLLWCAPISLFPSVLFFERNKFFFIGLVLAVIFIAFAVESYREEEKSNLKILLRRLIGSGMKLFFTALAVLFSFIYYGQIYQNPDPAKILLPESFFDSTIKYLEAPMAQIIPGFRASATADAVLGAAGRKAYAEQFGIRLTGKETMAEVLYVISLARIKNYAGDYLSYVPILATASYFFALKALSIIFYYLAILLIFILLKLFIVIGLVKKELIPAEKEVLI